MSYRKIYYTSPEACRGCRVCELVCSLHHEEIEINPTSNRFTITAKSPSTGILGDSNAGGFIFLYNL